MRTPICPAGIVSESDRILQALLKSTLRPALKPVLQPLLRHTLPALLLLLTFSCSPVRQYASLPEVLAWEPDIVRFESLSETEHYADDAIIFAGSSSIRLWSTLADDMEPFSIIQRGYGAARSTDFAVWADRIFAPLPGRALVLFIANDITGGDNDLAPAEADRLFRVIVKKFHKSHPGAPIFAVAVTPTSLRWQAWPQIKQANELIKKTCEGSPDLWFIETEEAFLNEEGMPRDELFLNDRLHLNREGYRVWNRIIKGELERVLR